MSVVAIFDLDHTLLYGDSELLLGEFMLGRGLVGADFIAAFMSITKSTYKPGSMLLSTRNSFSTL